MVRRRIGLVVLGAVAVLALAVGCAPPAAASVTGTGTFTTWAHCQVADTASFTFDARVGADGVPTGTFSFTCRPSGFSLAATVTCLQIHQPDPVTGVRAATIGGTITATTYPNGLFPVGQKLSVTVADGPSADGVSVLVLGCQRQLGLLPLASGDIVITGAPTPTTAIAA